MEITISHFCSISSSSMFPLHIHNKKNLSKAVSIKYLKEFEHLITKKPVSTPPPVTRPRAAVDENNISPSSGEEGRERWLLQPVGDGDTRHIGYKVDMPAPFQISSGQVTIGRLPEKADVVIPVATVSGVHARIDTKVDELLVTDLNSTNGTFIEDKRLTPGVPSPASPGTRITFGDTNLAIFRVFKLQDIEEEEDSVEKPVTM